jgi:drug/metabolite transporter (DMT)-like permease
MALATLCFAVLDSTGKYLIVKEGVPVAEVTWLRFVGHVVFSAAVLWPFALKPSLRSAKPLVQIFRSVLMVVTTAFNFIALRYLQLDQTVTIFFLTPLLVAALAGPLLHEWVGWHRMLAIVAGFFGVLLVMHPGIGTVHWAMLLALVATFGYALYNLATRYLAAFDPPSVTQTYTPLAGVLILAPFALGPVALASGRRPMGAARLAWLLGRPRPLAPDPGSPRRAWRRCWRRSSISA